MRCARPRRQVADVKRITRHGRPAQTPVDLAPGEAFELCVHTDGLHWWFYLPSAKGGLNQKRCHVIDLIEQKPEDAAADLMALLSRESVAGGGHLEAATAAHQNQKRKMATEFLPEAWNKVMSGPNKILVEILSDATEKLCGCKADPGVVEGFIRQHVAQWLLSDTAGDREPPRRREAAIPPAGPPAHPDKSSDIKAKKPEFFADKSINSFTFQGNTFPVKSWEQMLTTLCNHFAATHSQKFEKVLWMYDDHQPCFSRYSDQLRIPEKIRKTNIYVETKLAPEEIVKTVGDLLTEFGHGHEELVITPEEGFEVQGFKQFGWLRKWPQDPRYGASCIRGIRMCASSNTEGGIFRRHSLPSVFTFTYL
jgi:hypothetical protein